MLSQLSCKEWHIHSRCAAFMLTGKHKCWMSPIVFLLEQACQWKFFSFMLIVFEPWVLLDGLWHVLIAPQHRWNVSWVVTLFLLANTKFDISPDLLRGSQNPISCLEGLSMIVVDIDEGWMCKCREHESYRVQQRKDWMMSDTRTLTTYASCPFCRAKIILETHIQ